MAQGALAWEGRFVDRNVGQGWGAGYFFFGSGSKEPKIPGSGAPALAGVIRIFLNYLKKKYLRSLNW